MGLGTEDKQVGAVDMSRVRNATRDMAESMRRFDANWARMQREMQRASEEGATHSQLTATATEALRGDPDLLRRVNELTARMATQPPTKESV